jgi:DNA-binding transcriptional regulator/RsmH inhibitor MraZ
MSQFNDKYLHSIDAKGRLQLSRPIRGQFRLKKGDRLHLLPNLDNPPFLEIRTEKQWQEYQTLFMSQAPGGLKRDFVRFVELSKETVVADAQGRIIIPKRLRELCGLEDEVAVINMNTCVEVWNKENVKRKYADLVRAFKDINNSLF